MEAARTRTAAVIGVQGHLVEVEADITEGLPATIPTGLPDTVLREARDRVRAAIVNSGESWPCSKITVGLYPAMLPKRGSAYDLAIAIAIMAANGGLPARPKAQCSSPSSGSTGDSALCPASSRRPGRRGRRDHHHRGRHRDVLDALRQPLESGKVVIFRASARAMFPARFTLVLAASPCPCAATAAAAQEGTGCRCSPARALLISGRGPQRR
jgi:predicted ATPase with chaperone activity